MVKREILEDTFARASIVVFVGIALFVAGRLSSTLCLFDLGLILIIIGLLGVEFVIFICLFCKVEQ